MPLHELLLALTRPELSGNRGRREVARAKRSRLPGENSLASSTRMPKQAARGGPWAGLSAAMGCSSRSAARRPPGVTINSALPWEGTASFAPGSGADDNPLWIDRRRGSGQYTTGSSHVLCVLSCFPLHRLCLFAPFAALINQEPVGGTPNRLALQRTGSCGTVARPDAPGQRPEPGTWTRGHRPPAIFALVLLPTG